MTKLDNIVCWSIGIISGGVTGTLVDLAIQSSQKYTTASRIALDVVAGGTVLFATTFAAYWARNKICYEQMIEDKHSSQEDYIHSRPTTIYHVDKRDGKIVKTSIYKPNKTENRSDFLRY